VLQPLQERQSLRQGVTDVLEQARREPSTLTTEQPEDQTVRTG